MGQRVIGDNWSLQTVGSMLLHGLDVDDNPGIHPLTDPGSTPAVIPQAALDIEALFDLVTDIVLRDQILVDERFQGTWLGQHEVFEVLLGQSILKPHPFLDQADRLEEPRKEFVRRLVLNEVMASEQSANEATWRAERVTPHAFTSQLVWGGAGMLARAFVNEAAYTPHPLRRRLFERAKIAIPSPPSTFEEFGRATAEHREALYRPDGANESVAGLNVLLPAVPALVLRDANSLLDIFKIALQIRQEFGQLRAWLSQLQDATAMGDAQRLMKERATLRALRRDVERAMGVKSGDAPTLNVGWSWLKVTCKVDVAKWVPRWNRVQIQTNTLVFAPSGHAEIRKLLGLFDHAHSTVGLRTIEHFSRPKKRERMPSG